MGLLTTGSSGIVKQPPIIILYGDGGLGKDTWASQAPNPYFLDINGGTSELNVTRSPKITDYDRGISFIDALINDEHPHKTLVISGIDDLEGLLFQKIVREDGKAKNMVTAAGGYGNGYKVAMEHWLALQKKLWELRDKKGMGVIIICHPLAYTYNDPNTATGYDRIRLKLHEGSKESAAKLWFDFADAVFYVRKKVYLVGDTRRAMDEGKHYIYTQGRAAFDAKSRYQLPFELELDYASFAKAMKHVKTGPELIEEINTLSKELKPEDQAKVNAAIDKYKNSVHDLSGLLEQVKTILSKV